MQLGTTSQSLSLTVVFLAISLAGIAIYAGTGEEKNLVQKITPGTVHAVFSEGTCRWESLDFHHDIHPENSTPQLYLPTGVSVTIQSTSKDTVYISYQKPLGLELLAIPEFEYSTTVIIDEPGIYELQLSPSCGMLWSHKGTLASIIAVKEQR